MAGDDLLSQIQHASDTAKNLLYDLLNGGHAAEEAIARVFRDGLDQVNHAFGSTLDIPGLAKAVPPKPAAPLGAGQRICDWMLKNRIKTGAIIVVLCTGVAGAGVVLLRSRARRRSGKAKRTKHGARKEVVVLMGNASYTPAMRSIALDLEVRGFIIYVVVFSHDDLLSVQKEARLDIKPMQLDNLDPEALEDRIREFHDFLNSKHQAISSVPRHQLELTGIIVAPEVSGTVKRVDHISTTVWTQFMSSRVSKTITSITSFLPLVIEHQARIVMLTPTVVRSMTSPLHSMESTAVSALNTYTHCLRRELSPFGVLVSQIQLGSFDFGALQHGSQAQRAREVKGSPPRLLHGAVFDALTMKSSIRMQRVGAGASFYGIIGDYVPTSLIDWWMSRKTGRMSFLLT